VASLEVVMGAILGAAMEMVAWAAAEVEAGAFEATRWERLAAPEAAVGRVAEEQMAGPAKVVVDSAAAMLAAAAAAETAAAQVTAMAAVVGAAAAAAMVKAAAAATALVTLVG
jgi:hypothetical protein